MPRGPHEFGDAFPAALACGDAPRLGNALEHRRQYDWMIASIGEVQAMRYVVGGNTREAEDLIRRRQLTDCVPLDRAEMLESIDAPEAILTGTFIARADVQAFYDLFKRINAKPHFML
jgi:hypothetical protein